MTDDDLKAIRQIWKQEREREMSEGKKVFGVRWVGPSLGSIAVLLPVVIVIAIGWSDQRNQTAQNTKTLEQLSTGFAQLSKLANDLNSDNVLQKYQIEQAQREIESLRRKIAP